MKVEHIDQVKNPPTLKTSFGAAWELSIEDLRKKAGVSDNDDCSVAAWVVFCPWAHMLWSYYYISAVHLRPTAKFPSPKILLMGATHEIFVAALDPQKVPNLDNPCNTWLKPLNFAGQWIVNERNNPIDLDKAAALKVRRSVEEILSGVLSPDTDYRSLWVRAYSASNLR